MRAHGMMMIFILGECCPQNCFKCKSLQHKAEQVKAIPKYMLLISIVNCYIVLCL